MAPIWRLYMACRDDVSSGMYYYERALDIDAARWSYDGEAEYL